MPVINKTSSQYQSRVFQSPYIATLLTVAYNFVIKLYIDSCWKFVVQMELQKQVQITPSSVILICWGSLLFQIHVKHRSSDFHAKCTFEECISRTVIQNIERSKYYSKLYQWYFKIANFTTPN